MTRQLAVALLLAVSASPVFGDEILLPVFAHNMADGKEAAWSSEVYVTNRGPEEARVTLGSFLPGRIDDKPPCQTLLQPFIVVPPESTVLWRTGEINIGIGCHEFAAGGLLFHSDRPVSITSRMVKHARVDGAVSHPLSGIGQEIDAIDLRERPRGSSRLILPAVGWHPNACEPSLLDTNVFLTNPEPTPVSIEIDAPPGSEQLIVDGQLVEAPYRVELDPWSQRVIRLAGPGSPMLPVCLEPVIGSFSLSADGPVSVVASILDRRSGDARTSPALTID